MLNLQCEWKSAGIWPCWYLRLSKQSVAGYFLGSPWCWYRFQKCLYSSWWIRHFPTKLRNGLEYHRFSCLCHRAARLRGVEIWKWLIECHLCLFWLSQWAVWTRRFVWFSSRWLFVKRPFCLFQTTRRASLVYLVCDFYLHLQEW